MIQRILFLSLILSLLVGSALAQSSIVTTIDSGRTNSATGFARDFWFSMIKNYEADAGKWYEAYVTSPMKTTAKISIGKAAEQKFAINAYEVLVFRIPLAWELSQSNVVEDKAIHVWSEDADLNVLLMSRNPATSASMSVLPTSGWSTSYVIASFASYAYYAQYDLPSEFAIVANQDNTVVTITPTVDIRQGLSRTEIAHPKGKPFSVSLMKGQAVQYMCTYANGNMEDFNLTGTTITSNRPVGVVAGVQCANVPAENTACDHIAEMLLPTDRWGKRYYSVPFAKRVGGDGFLVVAKEDATTVYRTSKAGTRVHCVLNRNETYMVHDIDQSSEWTGNKPFMLVQYMNSTDYPTAGANAQIGDPAMVVLTPVESYEKSYVFQTPKITPGTGAFRNYVNMIVPKSARTSLKLDGQSLNSAITDSLSIPANDFLIFTASDLTPGSHTISADSGVGSYVYGYGWYEAYAHPGGGFGIGVIGSEKDVRAPQITALNVGCYSVDIAVLDDGQDQVGWISQSIDTMDNAKLLVNQVVGAKNEWYNYYLKVIDSSKPMMARIRLGDGAGNYKLFTHSYVPSFPAVTSKEVTVYGEEGEDIWFSIPITARADSSMDVEGYWLTQRKQFQEVDGSTHIDAGETDSIFVRYRQSGITTAFDTIVIYSDCWVHRIPLRGTPVPFAKLEIVDTINYAIVVLGNKRTRSLEIKNVGTQPIRIESLSLAGNPDFTLEEPLLPFDIAQEQSLSVDIEFKPVSEGPKQAVLTIGSSIGMHIVHLTGLGRDLSSVEDRAEDSRIRIHPVPAQSILHVTTDSPIEHLQIVDLTGKVISTFKAGAEQVDVDLNEIPSGIYVLEVHASGQRESIKFTIAR